MNEFELNLRLKQEMESMAPNRLEALLAACKDAPVKPNIESIATHRKRRAPRFAAVAAAFVLLFVGSFCGLKEAQRSVVTMEVNPSVSFTVNGFDRVRSVSLNNPDAEALFDADTLRGKSLDNAVESVSGILMERNILRADANGVLVSVSDAGARRAAAIGNELLDGLNDAAEEFGFEPSVTLLSTRDAQPGSDVLRSVVISRVAGLPAEKAEVLGVQELLYVVQSQNLPVGQLKQFGELQGWVCESGRDAERIAAADAGVSEAANDFITLLGMFEDQLAYQVSFPADGGWLTYWISAATGEILSRPAAPASEAPAIVPAQSGTGSYSQGQGNAPAPDPAPSQKPSAPFDSFRDFFDFIDDLI